MLSFALHRQGHRKLSRGWNLPKSHQRGKDGTVWQGGREDPSSKGWCFPMRQAVSFPLCPKPSSGRSSPQASALEIHYVFLYLSYLKTANKQYHNPRDWSMVSPTHIYYPDVAAHSRLVIIYMPMDFLCKVHLFVTFMHACVHVWGGGGARSSPWKPSVLPTGTASSSFSCGVNIATPTPTSHD